MWYICFSLQCTDISRVCHHICMYLPRLFTPSQPQGIIVFRGKIFGLLKSLWLGFENQISDIIENKSEFLCFLSVSLCLFLTLSLSLATFSPNKPAKNRHLAPCKPVEKSTPPTPSNWIHLELYPLEQEKNTAISFKLHCQLHLLWHP